MFCCCCCDCCCCHCCWGRRSLARRRSFLFTTQAFLHHFYCSCFHGLPGCVLPAHARVESFYRIRSTCCFRTSQKPARPRCYSPDIAPESTLNSRAKGGENSGMELDPYCMSIPTQSSDMRRPSCTAAFAFELTVRSARLCRLDWAF
jgi:hypothetical protein